MMDEKEREKLVDMIEDLFNQSCRMPNDKFEHMFISAYEEAQDFLIEEGRIKAEDCAYS